MTHWMFIALVCVLAVAIVRIAANLIAPNMAKFGGFAPKTVTVVTPKGWDGPHYPQHPIPGRFFIADDSRVFDGCFEVRKLTLAGVARWLVEGEMIWTVYALQVVLIWLGVVHIEPCERFPWRPRAFMAAWRFRFWREPRSVWQSRTFRGRVERARKSLARLWSAARP